MGNNGKRGLEGILPRTLVIGLVVGATYAAKGAVEVEMVPETSGSAVVKLERGENYRFYAWAHNDTAEVLRSAQFKPVSPANLAGHLICMNACSEGNDYGRPSPKDDIFGGVNLPIEILAPIGQPTGLITSAGDAASAGASGYLEFFDVGVSSNAPAGPFDFGLNELEFTNGGMILPYSIANNYSFEVVPRKGDLNNDFNVDGNDISVAADILTGNDPDANRASWLDYAGNNDGFTDGRDIRGFVDAYMANGN
jgi:hypothetical protein